MSKAAVFMQQALAGVLIALIAVPPATAASKTKAEKHAKAAPGSELTGRVLRPDGTPVRGAVVVVRSVDGDVSWTSKESDSRGRFAVKSLPYGWADLVVRTDRGEFLGDQAINLPPGTRVVVNFNLLDTADKPASWWTDRRVELPAGLTAEQVAGMAQSSQKLTGVEYWKSPAGIAILVSVGVVVLGFIAAGGSGYNAPSPTNP
jgi:hypothetical protein